MFFSFVILHYNVVVETLKCVESIKELCDAEKFSIIIVDNGSPNESGTLLLEKFQKDPLVSVLLTKKNLGFANGNNIGIRYAREKFKADFVIVLNNDTFLIQKDFCKIIKNEWAESHFAVLGPHVHTYSGKNQNPVLNPTTTIEQANYWIKKHRRGLFRSYLCIDSLWLNLLNFVKRHLKANERNDKKSNDYRLINVKLHGCCLVFSPVFFENFNGFDSRTFMYTEEDILYVQLQKKKLLSVYNPKLQIFHAEKAATKSVNKTSRKKKIFIYKECIKSLKVLKKVIVE